MNLSEDSIRWALSSLQRHGDTDLFPRLPELECLLALGDETVTVLAGKPMAEHEPSPPRRFVVPKDDLSFRSATQLDIVDTILLTGLMRELGQGIEDRRRPVDEETVFSYRFVPSDDGDLFSEGDSWNRYWTRVARLARERPYAVVADISDFYNQIYHHALENQLLEAGWPNQAVKWILRLLGVVTVKVSRGVPVGPHAAHLLAEATLIPIDNSFAARGWCFCRFVDDMVVFADSQDECRQILLEIATILDKQQRLQLAKQKTRILTSGELISLAGRMMEDRPINRDEADIIKIIAKHSDGNPYKSVSIGSLSDEELRAFRDGTVHRILEEYVGHDAVDFVRLRWFLRRLAQVGHPAAVTFCLDHFGRILPALSEVCHYLISVHVAEFDAEWPAVGERILDILELPLVKASEYAQLSLHSLFGRNPELNHLSTLLGMYSNASPYIRREIILSAVGAGAVDWLRELKEGVSAMDPWSKRAFLVGARSFPADEKKFFLRTIEASHLSDELVLRWAKT